MSEDLDRERLQRRIVSLQISRHLTHIDYRSVRIRTIHAGCVAVVAVSIDDDVRALISQDHALTSGFGRIVRVDDTWGYQDALPKAGRWRSVSSWLSENSAKQLSRLR